MIKNYWKQLLITLYIAIVLILSATAKADSNSFITLNGSSTGSQLRPPSLTTKINFLIKDFYMFVTGVKIQS